MRNKAVLMVLVLLSSAGFPLLANGAGETADGGRPWGGRTYSGEPITLTGSLDLQPGNGFAALKVGSETWSLMVPHMYGYDVPVKSGDTVTVTGFETSGPRRGRGDGERYLMVQKALIDGREYVLPGGYGRESRGWGPGMMGPGGMMGGGRGRGWN